MIASNVGLGRTGTVGNVVVGTDTDGVVGICVKLVVATIGVDKSIVECEGVVRGNTVVPGTDTVGIVGGNTEELGIDTVGVEVLPTCPVTVSITVLNSHAKELLVSRGVSWGCIKQGLSNLVGRIT